jgi:antitoxin component of RelBE/YafQ-DinJ toxin-antitoxin module
MRDQHISVRVTVQEKSAIHLRADEYGMSMSDYMRWCHEQVEEDYNGIPDETIDFEVPF